MRVFASASVAWEQDKRVSNIDGLTLERIVNSADGNPYLVVGVNKELIRDRNDIDDPRIIEFIKQLILISTQSPQRKEMLQRSLGGVGQ